MNNTIPHSNMHVTILSKIALKYNKHSILILIVNLVLPSKEAYITIVGHIDISVIQIWYLN